MNKKLMSVIAAGALAVCGSPISANALYTERMTGGDYSDFIKIEYKSDDKVNYYIYNGTETRFIDPENPYYRRAVREEKLSDRIYFNIAAEEGAESAVTVGDNATSGQINLLFKDFETENGDAVQVHGSIFSGTYKYYAEPSNGNKKGDVLRLTANDVRRIRDILVNEAGAADIIFADDVNSPSNGSIDLCEFTLSYEYYVGKTKEDRAAKLTEIKQQVEEFATEKGFDVTVSGESIIFVRPNKNISLAEMAEITGAIDDNFDDIALYESWQCDASESFGGIDLMNAVDGDSNCDEEMDMADVVFIMQSLANPNKYQITKQGRFNADLDGNGLTVGDAQAIQETLLGLR
ncbi:MAG: hypothetical protein K6G33_06595 [Ruminococcus sp.]|uniref:hypothetical protein n=1 Tax=Ruminococcus sp. TaxID=41978 RepID=UPI002600C00C|nr:hypothetical protein [Ruminococcus sp.]MCR5600387.1 hypothetical protein [Ruminococcus sp.]